MAKLSEHHKIFIIQRLACFDTLAEVRDALKEEHGIELVQQHIQAYDPTKYAGRNLSKKFVDLFHETRKQFQEHVNQIPLANQANRLRELEKLYFKAKTMGNLALAAQLLEQLSKETGGAYTNKIKAEHTGKDGGPIQSTHAVINVTGAPPALQSQETKDGQST